MIRSPKVLVLNLPSPPNLDVCRDYAGGFGVAWSARRACYGQTRKPIFNPFIPYIAAVLTKEGYDYNVIDCQQKKLDEKNVLKHVKKVNPDFIISMIGLPSMKHDLRLLSLIKNTITNCFIIGIGTVCRTLTNEVLLHSKIDVLVRNDFPFTSNVAELIKTQIKGRHLKNVYGISFRFKNRVVNTPELCRSDFNQLQPNYDKIELNDYENFIDKEGNSWTNIAILTGKGCPHPCNYCPYPIGFGKKWLGRYPKNIVDEIEYLYSRGVKSFTFRDQVFTISKKRTIEVCREIISRKLDVSWICEARVDQVSRDLLSLMGKSGCKRINYGVETGAVELINYAKPGIVLATTKKAFNITKEADIMAGAHIILGWPEENLKTLQETCELISILDPDSLNLNILTPYPGTAFYEFAKKQGLIVTYDWTKYTSHTAVIKTKYLNPPQIQEAADKIMRKYVKRQILRLLCGWRSSLFTVKRLMSIVKEKLLVNN